MFCVNCGKEISEGIKFCPHCGKEIGAVNSTGQPQNENSTGTAKTEKVKKEKKFPKWIIAVIAVVVVLVAVFAISGGGNNGYSFEATVRAWKPYASTQGIDATCGEVFDKYLPGAEWTVTEEDDTHADVIIKGTTEGGDNEFEITVDTVFESDSNAKMNFEKVILNGGDVSGENVEAGFFVGYKQGYDNLSNIVDIVTSINPEKYLTKEFKSDEHGISFKYPEYWNADDSLGQNELCRIYGGGDQFYYATVEVKTGLLFNDYDALTGDESAVRQLVEDTGGEYVDYTYSDGIGMLKYNYGSGGDKKAAYELFYENGGNEYEIQFECDYFANETYLPIFGAIVDTISVEDLGGSAIGENTVYSDTFNLLLDVGLNGYYIEESDLNGLSPQELTYLRCSVYARYGIIFDSQELNDFFARYQWYAPNPNASTDDVSATELINAGLIREYQEENGLEYTPQ